MRAGGAWTNENRPRPKPARAAGTLVGSRYGTISGRELNGFVRNNQEDLLSLDDLRDRTPELRKRQQAIRAELNAIENQLAARAG
jgi:hypothetical protein